MFNDTRPLSFVFSRSVANNNFECSTSIKGQFTCPTVVKEHCDKIRDYLNENLEKFALIESLSIECRPNNQVQITWDNLQQGKIGLLNMKFFENMCPICEEKFETKFLSGYIYYCKCKNCGQYKIDITRQFGGGEGNYSGYDRLVCEFINKHDTKWIISFQINRLNHKNIFPFIRITTADGFIYDEPTTIYLDDKSSVRDIDLVLGQSLPNFTKKQKYYNCIGYFIEKHQNNDIIGSQFATPTISDIGASNKEISHILDDLVRYNFIEKLNHKYTINIDYEDYNEAEQVYNLIFRSKESRGVIVNNIRNEGTIYSINTGDNNS